jgi:hypothetical protein
MRFSLATLFAASIFGPWSGCDRAPVTPPATPPAERAPQEGIGPTDVRSDGILLLPATRRLG